MPSTHCACRLSDPHHLRGPAPGGGGRNDWGGPPLPGDEARPRDRERERDFRDGPPRDGRDWERERDRGRGRDGRRVGREDQGWDEGRRGRPQGSRWG